MKREYWICNVERFILEETEDEKALRTIKHYRHVLTEFTQSLPDKEIEKADLIKNMDEITAYQEAAAKKSDFERSEIAKDKTGVEMEALTGVSVAALTIYDMCKAVDKDMIISDIMLQHKSGGKSGEYIRKNK